MSILFGLYSINWLRGKGDDGLAPLGVDHEVTAFLDHRLPTRRHPVDLVAGIENQSPSLAREGQILRAFTSARSYRLPGMEGIASVNAVADTASCDVEVFVASRTARTSPLLARFCGGLTEAANCTRLIRCA